jgi:hypothetical protein
MAKNGIRHAAVKVKLAGSKRTAKAVTKRGGRTGRAIDIGARMRERRNRMFDTIAVQGARSVRELSVGSFYILSTEE